MDGFGEMVLWFVQGVAGEFYATKMQAEVRARVVFPIEDPEQRDARIFYKTFYTVDPN